MSFELSAMSSLTVAQMVSPQSGKTAVVTYFVVFSKAYRIKQVGSKCTLFWINSGVI
jgi:hypothetical protein